MLPRCTFQQNQRSSSRLTLLGFYRETAMSILGEAHKLRNCPDYAPVTPGSKRCSHYRDRLCELPAHPLCEEWLRANPEAELPRDERFADAGLLLQSRPDYRLAVIAGAYFGPGWESKLAPDPDPFSDVPDDEPDHDDDGLTSGETRTLDRLPSDIELQRWKDLKCEVCIVSPAIDEVWLVPKYTGTDRDEISIDDAMTMLRVLTAFPGSRIDKFIRKGKGQ